MLQQIKYRFIATSRDRLLTFWVFLFPLLLCSLFYCTFGHIDSGDIDTINAALVVKSNDINAEMFCDFLKELENSDPEFISITKTSNEDALELLKKGNISGIYYADKTPELSVTKSDIKQSILKSIISSYNKRFHTDKEYVIQTTATGKEINGIVQYFYSLIAMSCLFGSFLGMEASLNLQANIRAVGARRCVSPMHKFKMIFADTFVINLINFSANIILLIYMKFILHIDIGTINAKIILVTFIGSLIGTSFGLFVGSIGKWREGLKMAIILSVSLISSFLSGLMASGIKGLVEEYCPIINRINPASLLTDAFYSISVYDNPARFTKDIISMSVMVVVFITGAFLLLRRVRYDSI